MLWRWLIAFLTWLSADPAVFDAERPKAAAALAAAKASLAETAPVPPAPPAPPAPKPGECCGECKGGWIVHGDGHRTACPCQASCRCKKAGASALR